jgi:hypothetical protein
MARQKLARALRNDIAHPRIRGDLEETERWAAT